VVVAIGFAHTVAVKESLNVVFGLHKYVSPPDAESCVLSPKQIAIAEGETCIGGRLFTVTRTVSRVRHVPAPLLYTSVNVPAVLGVNDPSDVIPVPDQAPPLGLPTKKRIPLLIQTAVSLPALTGVGSMTDIRIVSLLVQLFVGLVYL
jgi:hypothetical protein